MFGTQNTGQKSSCLETKWWEIGLTGVHVRKHEFTDDTTTTNATEGKNHSYKAKYLNMGSDKTLTTVIGDLIYVAPGEQEDEYKVDVARQSDQYRTVISDRIDELFRNRPRPIMNMLVRNKEYAACFERVHVKEAGPDSPGIYIVSKSLSRPDLVQFVDFLKGTCDCTTFTNKYKIPCPHMMAVSNHTDLTLKDLPNALLKNETMTLHFEELDHRRDGTLDIDSNHNHNGNIPPIVQSQDDTVRSQIIAARGQVLQPLPSTRTEHRKNEQFRKNMAKTLRRCSDDIYGLTNDQIGILRANVDILSAVESVRNAVDEQLKSDNGSNRKLNVLQKPMNIYQQKQSAKRLDVQRLKRVPKLNKKDIPKVKKTAKRIAKNAKKTQFNKSKEAEDIQRKCALERAQMLKDKVDDMSKDKAYKTSSKVNKRGPIRRSKRLRGIESVEVHVRIPKRKRARK